MRSRQASNWTRPRSGSAYGGRVPPRRIASLSAGMGASAGAPVSSGDAFSTAPLSASTESRTGAEASSTTPPTTSSAAVSARFLRSLASSNFLSSSSTRPRNSSHPPGNTSFTTATASCARVIARYKRERVSNTPAPRSMTWSSPTQITTSRSKPSMLSTLSTTSHGFEPELRSSSRGSAALAVAASTSSNPPSASPNGPRSFSTNTSSGQTTATRSSRSLRSVSCFCTAESASTTSGA
mmetsp:Transcript_8610/g.24479  ORF Transcript_8610/g.24479 Transcript_8610/m.24479 type:complete len:239 (-) Transcript_8610:3155-3871(-)